jgi:hypothetical protein
MQIVEMDLLKRLLQSRRSPGGVLEKPFAVEYNGKR